MTLKVTDIDPFPAEMSGETITVEVDGKEYKVENWATDSSSGCEIYDDEGNAVYSDTPTELDEWESDEDPKVKEFYARWAAEVGPLVEKIKKEVFGG